MLGLFFLGAFSLLLAAPAPERQALPTEDASACVDVFQGAVYDFARNLKALEADAVNDMKLFSDVQRGRIRGFLVLLRAMERELVLMENLKLRELLLDGCREQSLLLQRALLSLKDVEQKTNAVDLHREVGAALLDATPFAKFYRAKGLTKPTVGEIVIPAP